MRVEIWGVKSLPADALAPAEGPGRLLIPFGTENLVGRLGLGGDVWLNSRPKIRIEDLQIISDLGGDADPSNDRLELNATLTNTSKRPCVGCSGGRIGCGESDANGGRSSLRSVYAPGSLDAAADQDDQDDAVWASS